MLVPIALAVVGCAGDAPSISSAPALSTATPASSGEACAEPEANATPTAWWGDRVFYEVFVRSFADSDGDGIGDLRGLTAHLDDLNDGDTATTGDLGVTGLWLMPIAESPSYHGYDVIDYRAVEPANDLNAAEGILDEHRPRLVSIFDRRQTRRGEHLLEPALQPQALTPWAK